MALTKSQILSQLAEANGITKAAAGDFLESLVELAYKEAANGFTIPGLGKLVV
jgi:nucleoid DNA-binding protein